MERQKSFLYTFALTLLVVAISFIALGIYLISLDNLSGGVIVFAIALIAIAGGIWYIRGGTKTLAMGQPLVDELSIQWTYKAGYAAWSISFILWAAIASMIDTMDPPRYGIYLGMLCMLIAFGFSYVVFRMKGQGGGSV